MPWKLRAEPAADVAGSVLEVAIREEGGVAHVTEAWRKLLWLEDLCGPVVWSCHWARR